MNRKSLTGTGIHAISKVVHEAFRKEENDSELIEMILSRFVQGGEEEKNELYLQFRNLREDFAFLDKKDRR